MSSGGGSSSWSEQNGRTRELIKRLGMDPDNWSNSKNRRLDSLLNRFGLEDRSDLGNDETNHFVQMKAEKLGKWAKNNNVNLGEGSLTKSFGNWQQTLALEDEDRIVGTDADGDGITDPIDVDPGTEGFQYDDPRWGGDPDAAKLTVHENIQAEQQRVGRDSMFSRSRTTGKLDLTEDKVAELSTHSFGITEEDYKTEDERNKVIKEIAEGIETQFIDELYGTEERNIATVDFYGEGTGALFGGERGGFGGAGIDPLYGLDLARTMKDENGDPIEYDKNAAADSAQNQAFYEAITRGKVDWAHYYNDNTYRRVFRKLEMNIKDLSASKLSPGQRVELIRKADTYIADEKTRLGIDQESELKGKDADGVRYGELEGFKIKPGEPMYVGIDHKLEGATEESFQLYIDGERQITMGEKLSILPGDSAEINVAPPGSDPVYKTVKSAYQDITRPSKEDIRKGGTFTIGGDIDTKTGRKMPSKTISVEAVKEGMDWDFLKKPPTLGGGVTWSTSPKGRKIPSLTNPTARKAEPDIKLTAIPDIPKAQLPATASKSRLGLKQTTLQEGGKE